MGNCPSRLAAGVRCWTDERASVGGGLLTTGLQGGRAEGALVVEPHAELADSAVGYVCWEGASEAAANAACHELGYASGELLGPFARDLTAIPVSLDEVNCSGSEGHLDLCSVAPGVDGGCPRGLVAGARCWEPADEALPLAGG